MFQIFNNSKDKQIKKLRKKLFAGDVSQVNFYEQLYDIDYGSFVKETPSEFITKIETEKLSNKITQQFNTGYITKTQFKEKIKDVDIEKWKTVADEKEILEYDLNFKFDTRQIDENEYYRELATLEDRPYVNIVNIEMDAKGIGTHSVEFDWNDKFIEVLKENGFEADTPEEMVDKWFISVSTAIASESDSVIITDPEDVRKINPSGKSEHY